MSKRFVVVGGATAVAGLVLGASIVLGPDAIQKSESGLGDDIQAPGVTAPGDPDNLSASVRDFNYTTFELDKDGELRGMRLRASRTRLKPLGITELTDPRAEVRLGSQRAITITADQADMLMEDRKPREGQFMGNVVVTLLQAPEGVKLVINPDDPAHETFVQQRIFLDDPDDPDQAIYFSIEEDTITTPGPVHATSPQVDFFGIGLDLAYNTQRRRIERLTIDEGRYLIYNPDAEAPGFAADAQQQAADDDTADTDATADNNTAAAPVADAERGEASGTTPHPPPPSQFYAADFHDDVVIRDAGVSELAGQRLSIDFSLGTPAIEPGRISPPGTDDDAGPADADASDQANSNNPRRALPRYLLASRTELAQAQNTDRDTAEDTGQAASPQPSPAPLPVIAIPERNTERSLFEHRPQRDVVVTWTGQLQVTPYADKPPALADDEDAQVTLAGPTAYAQTTRNGELERLETGRLEYLLSQERAVAYARPDNTPARIRSKAMGGEILGRRITLNQQAATASVQGPGQLTYTNQDDGKTLTLTWQNRLDLELYTQPANADTEQSETPTPTANDNQAPQTPTLSQSEASGTARSPRTKILGIKTATFDNTVTARHTDFDLDADKLTIAFAKPDEARGIDNSPTAINAQGNIAVLARGDAEDERFDINAQRLSINLERDVDGEPYASTIRAVESVDVRRPGSVLTCDRVEVELLPPSQTQQRTARADAEGSDTPTPTLSDSEASGTERSEASGTSANQPLTDRAAQVRSILSVGNVRAKLDYDDRRVDLIADQLLADVQQDRLTLSSNTNSQLAEVFDLGKQQKITGQLIVMDDQAEALDITGPGSLATRLSDPTNPDAGLEDAFLAINWTESMAFSNITGKAEFYENVRSESRRSTDTSELTCDQLVMQFSPDYKRDPHRLVEDEGKDKHQREVRSAVATGSVKFTASAFDPIAPDELRNRTLLEGPKLVFTNKPATTIGDQPVETLQVVGEGHMLLEDYRPPEEQDQDNRAFVTGRGATLFTWENSMLLNARTNTATLTDTVQMVHRPKDDDGQVGDVVTLNGEKLVADLTDTGGLSVWLSDEAPDAQIATINVDGGVRLRNSNRAMAGDHLAYTAETDRVTVWTDPGRDVVLRDLERDADTRTNKVIWDLTNNRIEIDQLRGGVAPLE